MKILFVCKANSGRSQLAEAIFNKLCEYKHQAISAGTKVIREDANREGTKISDPNIITVMKEMGVDISNNVRNQVTPEMLEKVDKVVILAEPEFIPEYLRQNEKSIFWEIPDTYNQSLEFVRGVQRQLQILISNFIKTLN
jgi:protein-tyrosine-phosphatase